MALEIPSWLIDWMRMQTISLWNIADLEGFVTPKAPDGHSYGRAISWCIPMDPHIMVAIRSGPNQPYADEYGRVNQRINQIADDLRSEIISRGHQALALAASERTDAVNIKGDFPHKTAATQAGLGWIGRHCQLITRPYGPWVRLGTVFTNMVLPAGPAIQRSFCGSCTQCVDACPAGAIQGKEWRPGVSRKEILDVRACDVWKKTHYAQYHNGHNCGICSAVCPYGIKAFKKRRNART